MSQDFEVFSGGLAVITGAGAGIGSGLARRAAELEMTVVVADIAEPRAAAVVDEIRAKGGKAEAAVVDVSKPEELDRFAAMVNARFGDVRLLINNAGIETIGYTWEIPAARWEDTLNINLHGVVHGVRAFVPYMLKSGKPAWIGNLSSVGGFSMMPTQTAYILTKHAVQSFSECLYLEMALAKAPIHVSSIIPGMLKTSIFDAAAGTGEPENASRHRTVMRELMQNHGMDLAAGCKIFLEKMAAGEFWVSSQPEMTEQVLAARIQFLQDQDRPALSAQARQLLDM
jgi:NAD(P)-dependent dehydrogenase (short-subunit alcohol dehydrogenase family)